MVLTKAGNLTDIRYIIHMVGQTNVKGITTSMFKVLKMCEENHIQSVSFPALGTGKKRSFRKLKRDVPNDAEIHFSMSLRSRKPGSHTSSKRHDRGSGRICERLAKTSETCPYCNLPKQDVARLSGSYKGVEEDQ